MENNTTKEKILTAAIKLFSLTGYDQVSMRDIAAEVGIGVASIYNHFPSKEDILRSMYDLYIEEHRKVIPSLEELYTRLETENINDLLMKTANYWEPYIHKNMDLIVLIAGQRIFLDKASEDFIRDQFFRPITDIWIPLLTRAIKIGKIESFDIASFIRLASSFAFCTVGLNSTGMKIDAEQWNNGMNMLFSLLKPLTKEKM
jgi:AcrR family transcriptional regulator